MAGLIKVNTAQVNQIASNIDSLNNKLDEQLRNSQTAIKSLANTWEGEAATGTITSYNEFAAKYFESYKDIINGYVKFLRTNVEQGYFDTESTNTTLADAFK